MRPLPRYKPPGTERGSNDPYDPPDARSIDWLDRPADQSERNNLADTFYLLLDHAAYREAFDDFLVPAKTTH
jgi:hypothetical protein